MKKILIFLLLAIYMQGVTLSLNSAKENGKAYGILHIKDDKPILCETKIKAYDKRVYLCMFDGDLQDSLDDKKTPFADIDFVTKEDKFYIYIKPLAYSFMINSDTKLYNDKTTPLLSKDNSKHWVIFLYDDKTLFKKAGKGINFPVTYSKFQYPAIGPLDLNGKPMDYAKSNDINIYLQLKKAYQKDDYETALSIANKIIKNYPDSIFISDILLYRLKSMDKILDNDKIKTQIDRVDITTEAKEWLKTFSSDKNRPEALMLLVKQYIHLRSKNDTNYYLDMLISEYPKSSSTQKAILLYADTLYKSNKKDEAIKLYEDVLYSSKDIDVASKAAIKLAKTSLENKKKEKTKEYLEKVLNANENFIYKDKIESYKLAQNLIKEDIPKIAAKIAELLLKKSKKFDEYYEVLLKDAGIWNERAGNTNRAYKLLKRYQKEFPYGDYEVLVQQTLDRLFFELNETNSTKLLAYYDQLIDKYDNEIGEKALLAKVNLLISKKEYESVLNLENEILKDKNNTQATKLMEKAATLFIQKSIDEDDCIGVVKVADKYKNALLHVNHDEGLYRCFSRLLRYSQAIDIAKKHLNDKKLPLRLDWLMKLQHSFFQNREYKKSIEVANDIEILGQMLNSKKANLALYDKYFSFIKLNNIKEALNIAKLIEQKLPDKFQNTQIYASVINIAKKEGNDLMVDYYAKKALELQKKSNRYILSPKLEYDYINSLQNLNRFEQANKIALELTKRSLTSSELPRALYVIGESFIKINDEKNANQYFLKCANLDKNNSWSSICKENLTLLDANLSK